MLFSCGNTYCNRCEATKKSFINEKVFHLSITLFLMIALKTGMVDQPWSGEQNLISDVVSGAADCVLVRK